MNWREWLGWACAFLLAVCVGTVYAVLACILAIRYGFLPAAALPAAGNPSGG